MLLELGAIVTVGSNGWFDIKVGVQFELGSNSGKWRRLIE